VFSLAGVCCLFVCLFEQSVLSLTRGCLFGQEKFRWTGFRLFGQESDKMDKSVLRCTGVC
jgi:hypothetical protein